MMIERLGFTIPAMLVAIVVAHAGQDGDVSFPGGGVAFDGTAVYAAPVKDVVTHPRGLTVTAWVNLDATADSQVFLNTGAANEGFTFYLYDGMVRMLVKNRADGYVYAVAPAPKPGEWTHYAGTYDGESVAVYMNGVLRELKNAPGQLTGLGEMLTFGGLDYGKRVVKGKLGDLRVYDRVLSETEIAAAAGGETASGPVARWTDSGRDGDTWAAAGSTVTARLMEAARVLLNRREDGYRGIWYYNQKSDDEYVYKYSGGLGTYCAKHIPFAWYAPQVNKTFFTYGGTYKNENRLIHMVSYFDHATGEVPRPLLLLDKQTDDAHDNPVINLDPDGYIWIFSSSHGTGRPSYISRSVEPYSIDRFELKWEGNFSYPQPWIIPGKGWLFMHTHYTGGRAICMSTSPDGVNWTERRFLSRMAQGHYQVTNFFGQKVGSAFNYHPPEKGLNWRTNLYYMESDDLGQTWKTAAGEVLEPMLTDPKSPCLVAEYESLGLNVYMKDINFDSAGRPVILYLTSKGYESGPKNMPRTWTIARWTGQDWQILPSNIISDNNYDMGSIYVETDAQLRLIAPTQVGPQPYNPGGEVAMWLSDDGGKSWTLVKQMTRNSPYNHTYVRRPVNAHPGFYGFWADGHGREPSISRLYFCNRDGDVFRLPFDMEGDTAKPELVEP
ncbi:MAG TPA: BNR-4 repeat-containing protein [Candidatus Hydrogenedentes bacterium]|nr:BNR-4 repeat-containing protein [Candidatus Hydrogenedentota bacterium]